MKNSVQTIIDSAKIFMQVLVWCAIMATSIILTADYENGFYQLLAVVIPSFIYGWITLPIIADIMNRKK